MLQVLPSRGIKSELRSDEGLTPREYIHANSSSNNRLHCMKGVVRTILWVRAGAEGGGCEYERCGGQLGGGCIARIAGGRLACGRPRTWVGASGARYSYSNRAIYPRITSVFMLKRRKYGPFHARAPCVHKLELSLVHTGCDMFVDCCIALHAAEAVLFIYWERTGIQSYAKRRTCVPLNPVCAMGRQWRSARCSAGGTWLRASKLQSWQAVPPRR